MSKPVRKGFYIYYMTLWLVRIVGNNKCCNQVLLFAFTFSCKLILEFYFLIQLWYFAEFRNQLNTTSYMSDRDQYIDLVCCWSTNINMWYSLLNVQRLILHSLLRCWKLHASTESAMKLFYPLTKTFSRYFSITWVIGTSLTWINHWLAKFPFTILIEP